MLPYHQLVDLRAGPKDTLNLVHPTGYGVVAVIKYVLL